MKDAEKLYNQNLKDIESLLNEALNEVEKAKDLQKTKNIHYGHVGTISTAKTDLQIILNALKCLNK